MYSCISLNFKIIEIFKLNFSFNIKNFNCLAFCCHSCYVLLFLGLLQWKKKVIKRIGDKKISKALISNYSSKRFTSKFIFLSFAFAVGVAAVMNPRKPGDRKISTGKELM